MRRLIGGMLLGCVAVASAHADEAQDATPLDEVLVTATRRDETLHDVPLSITTLTGEKLTEMGATKFDEYAPVVPGLSYTNCGCTPGEKYTFRGIATDGIHSSLRPLTAVYLDDTPVTYASGISHIAFTADPELVDIDRVEVIRGPQGTLFGANAMGGAIRILSREPELDFYDGSLGAEALTITDGGNGYGTRAMINVPIPGLGSAAVRAAGFYRYRQGYIDARDPDGLGTLVEPDLNDDATGGVRLTALYAPSDDLKLTARITHQSRRDGGSPIEDASSSTPTRSRIHAREPNKDDWTLANFGVTFALDDLRVFSNSSYLERRPYNTRDFTDLENARIPTQPNVPAQAQVRESARELTQEFRVQGAVGDDWDWLSGLYVQEQNTGAYTHVPAPGLDMATGGLATLAGDPDSLGTFVNVSRVRNYALFGDVGHAFAPRWKLALGARAYRITQRYQTDEYGLIMGVPPPGPASGSGSFGESGLTPRASLQFQPTPALSLYSTVAKGFRPGGVNLVTDSCESQQQTDGFAGTPRTFKSDTLWSYELGAKSRWFNDALYARGAVFHIDWNDIQTSRKNDCGISPIVDNSGAAKVNGVELTLTALPLPHLELELNEAYTDARFAENSLAAAKRKGDPVPDVPRNTFALAATYGLPHPQSFVRVDYQLRGSAPTQADVAAGRVDPYAQWHARAVGSFGTLQTTLAVRNLLNKRGAFTRESNDITGIPVEIRVPPRTVSLGVQYAF